MNTIQKLIEALRPFGQIEKCPTCGGDGKRGVTDMPCYQCAGYGEIVNCPRTSPQDRERGRNIGT